MRCSRGTTSGFDRDHLAAGARRAGLPAAAGHVVRHARGRPAALPRTRPARARRHGRGAGHRAPDAPGAAGRRAGGRRCSAGCAPGRPAWARRSGPCSPPSPGSRCGSSTAFACPPTRRLRPSWPTSRPGPCAVVPVPDGWRAELGAGGGDRRRRPATGPATKTVRAGRPGRHGRAPPRLQAPARPAPARRGRRRDLRRRRGRACSRPAPAWARAWPTCCRRPSSAPRRGAAWSSAPRRRRCSGSWPRTSCRSWPTPSAPAGAGRCSWAARTTSAAGGWTRPWPARRACCPTGTGRWRSPTWSAARGAARWTSPRCPIAPRWSWPPWPRWPATCAPRGPPAWAGTARHAAPVTGARRAPRPSRPTWSASTTPCCSPDRTRCPRSRTS